METEIDNSTDFTLSDTFQITFSVTSTCSQKSTGNKYHLENTFSDEVLSASVTKYLGRVPPYLNGVP